MEKRVVDSDELKKFLERREDDHLEMAKTLALDGLVSTDELVKEQKAQKARECYKLYEETNRFIKHLLRIGFFVTLPDEPSEETS